MVWILDSTVIDSGFFVSGSCIPDSNRYQHSGILEFYSGPQNPGFRILRAQIFRVLSVLLISCLRFLELID